MLSKYDTTSMVLVFDEVAVDLIETLIMSGDSAMEPFKTLQVNPCKMIDLAAILFLNLRYKE